MRSARTVFLGSGAFAVPILAALSDHPLVELAALVTAPRRPGSRGRPTDTPVAEWAAHHGVPAVRPERLRDSAAIAQIDAFAPELLVLADYGQIVPRALLDLPRHGALNLHPSLLPRHRGASPIAAAILAGDRETGVSLMQMDAGLDSGPIIAQRKFPLTGLENAPQLEHDLARLAAELLSAELEPWLAGEVVARPQATNGVSLTRPLRRADGLLDPTRDAASLERQVRAYQPWPGSHLETAAGRLVVWTARPIGGSWSDVVGVLVGLPDGGLAVTVGDGPLELVEVQPAGGRRMSGAELLRGRPWLIGTAVNPPTPADGGPYR